MQNSKMKNINLIILGLITLFFSVSCGNEETAVKACFTTSVAEANVGDEITYKLFRKCIKLHLGLWRQ